MWMVQKTIIIIEQGYINIGCDDDDDDGGCGESFFLRFCLQRKTEQKIQHRIFFTWSMLDTFFEFFCWWFSSRFIKWLALIWDEQNVRWNTC